MNRSEAGRTARAGLVVRQIVGVACARAGAEAGPPCVGVKCVSWSWTISVNRRVSDEAEKWFSHLWLEDLGLCRGPWGAMEDLSREMG